MHHLPKLKFGSTCKRKYFLPIVHHCPGLSSQQMPEYWQPFVSNKAYTFVFVNTIYIIACRALPSASYMVFE